MRNVYRQFASVMCAGIAALGFSGAQAQVAGSFDTTPFPGFALGNGFIANLAIGTQNDDRANAVALQPDGKIILAGTCAASSGTRFCLARLLPDGQLDASFIGPNNTPGNGKFVMTIAASTTAIAKAVAVQPDGKIVVAGTCSQKFCVARLNENGTFDTSFTGPTGNSAGHFSFEVAGFNDVLSGMALQSDGKLVLVGTCDESSAANTERMCVARLNANGSFDASFDGPAALNPGNGAFLIPTFDVGGRQFANAVAIRPTGRILIVGMCRSPSTNPDFCAAQLNSSGTLDSTFDGASSGNGKVKLGVYPFTPASAGAVALQADDKAVLVGSCSVPGCAARIQANGALDASFGDAVSNTTPAGVRLLSNSVGALSVAVQPDGKILILVPPGNGKFGVRRLNGDGTLDETFDGPPPVGNGVVSLELTTNSTFSNAQALQPDGKIVLAGYCETSSGATPPVAFCIARINGGSSGARNCTPDIDGDGRTTATIDGLILTRVMLGLTGTAVTGGITFPTAAPRKTWSAIRAYLVAQCGMTIAP